MALLFSCPVQAHVPTGPILGWSHLQDPLAFPSNSSRLPSKYRFVLLLWIILTLDVIFDTKIQVEISRDIPRKSLCYI